LAAQTGKETQPGDGHGLQGRGIQGQAADSLQQVNYPRQAEVDPAFVGQPPRLEDAAPPSRGGAFVSRLDRYHGQAAEAAAVGQQPTYVGPDDPNAAAYGQPWPAQTDARGYDLSHYMPPGQGYSPGQGAPSRFDGTAQWPDRIGYPTQQGEPSLDLGNYGADPNQPGDAYADEAYDEEGLEAQDAPPRSRRAFLMVTALIGAVIVGGALAYGYKWMAAPSVSKAPILRADLAPNKMRPAQPGGKEFAYTDKKLLNRLDEPGGDAQKEIQADPPAPSETGDDVNAPKKVKLISITPTAPGAPPQIAPGDVAAAGVVPVKPAPPVVAVPGVSLDNVAPLSPPPTRSLPPVIPAPPGQAVAPPPPPTTQAATRVAASAPIVPAEVQPAAKKVTRPAPKSVEKVRSTGATSGGNGYVAVLSSQKSRMDALKAYADMQQKYGDVLANKPADVQEADLGDKGLWYRAVVGPPGSREAASSLCGQLKSAGFIGCWVTAY
jgi:SPOR domain